MRQPLEERFAANVEPEPNSGCWLWLGGKAGNGYGVIVGGQGRRTLYAHRYAWQMAHSSIGGGLHVLHKCDTPACVNPSHLFLGTSRDNHRDAAEKGRKIPPGSRGVIFTRANTIECLDREDDKDG